LRHQAQASRIDQGTAVIQPGSILDVLDNLSAHVALLNKDGHFVFINSSLRERLRSPEGLAQGLLPCLSSLLKGCTNASEINDLLGDFLSGVSRKITTNYKVETDEGERWFRMRGSRIGDRREPLFLLINEDVSRIKKAEMQAARLATLLLSLQEDERQVISQELHDSTAQHLVAIDLSLMKLKSVIQPDQAIHAVLADIDRSLDEAVKELRTFTYLLHPAELAEGDLRLALHRYVQGFSRRSGLKAELEVDCHTNGLPCVLQQSILRIMQEALANVHRHANASCVRVRCRASGGRLRLLVVDNGHGIDKERDSLPRLGVGLPGMRMRVVQLGGTFSVRTGQWGTLIRASLPLDVSRAAGDGTATPSHEVRTRGHRSKIDAVRRS
jgi:two-component system NarL family sensor kinase